MTTKGSNEGEGRVTLQHFALDDSHAGPGLALTAAPCPLPPHTLPHLPGGHAQCPVLHAGDVGDQDGVARPPTGCGGDEHDTEEGDLAVVLPQELTEGGRGACTCSTRGGGTVSR